MDVQHPPTCKNMKFKQIRSLGAPTKRRYESASEFRSTQDNTNAKESKQQSKSIKRPGFEEAIRELSKEQCKISTVCTSKMPRCQNYKGVQWANKRTSLCIRYAMLFVTESEALNVEKKIPPVLDINLIPKVFGLCKMAAMQVIATPNSSTLASASPALWAVVLVQEVWRRNNPMGWKVTNERMQEMLSFPVMKRICYHARRKESILPEDIFQFDISQHEEEEEKDTTSESELYEKEVLNSFGINPSTSSTTSSYIAYRSKANNNTGVSRKFCSHSFGITKDCKTKIQCLSMLLMHSDPDEVGIHEDIINMYPPALISFKQQFT